MGEPRAARPCPEATWGFHGEPTHKGRCPYCDVKISHAKPKPRPLTSGPTDLEEEYRYYWDPDWQGNR